MSKYYLLSLAFFWMVGVLQAQKAQIEVHVSANGADLPFASLRLDGDGVLQQGSSDANGLFRFADLEAGKYQLQVQVIGYQRQLLDIELEADEQRHIDLSLEEDLLDLEQVVVTGTRSRVPLYESPIIVNTVSARTFEQTQSLSAAEGLSFSPGLRVENNCQNCGFTQLRMNGLEGPYSQILINSRPVFSALAGVYGLEMLPSNMIDRIEVVKGGGSVLYGGNAIGGTVNIITKDPTSNSFELGLNQAFTNMEGSDRTLNANGSIVSEDGNKGLSFYGFNRQRQQWDANGDGFSEVTQLRNITFGIDAFWNPSKYSKLRLSLNKMTEFRRGGNDFDLAPHQSDVAEQLEHDITGANLSYELSSKDYRHRFAAYVSTQYTLRDSYYGGGGRVLSPNDSLTESDLLAINAYGNSQDLAAVTGLQYSFDFATDWALTVGSEYQYNTVVDAMPGYDRQIDQTVGTLGSYAQLQWEATERLQLLAGGRLDVVNINGLYALDVEEFNNQQNLVVAVPRLTALYELRKNWQLRAAYAQGYRAPQAFDEDLHIETVGGAARFIRLRPDLQTERSHSYTASLNYSRSKGNWQHNIVLEGFHTLLLNPFILSDQEELPSGVAVIEKRNGSGAIVQGLNLEGNLAFAEKYLLKIGFTAQQARYTETELLWESEDEASTTPITSTDRLLRTPNFYGFFTFNYAPIRTFDASLSGVYTGAMDLAHVIDSETEYTMVKTTPNFLELNLKLQYHLPLDKTYRLTLFTGMQNMLNSFQQDFDRGAERDAGYVYGPIRPRTLFVGLKMGLN